MSIDARTLTVRVYRPVVFRESWSRVEVTMKPRSLRTAEREFFRNFFTALAARGESSIDRRDPQMPLRFLRAVERLKQSLDEKRKKQPALDLDIDEQLVTLLQPDPLSGTMLALERALIELQLSELSMPNPSYESLRLLLPKSTASSMLSQLDRDERELFAELADAFVGEQDEPSRKAS